MLLVLRPLIENELKSKVGFLDELNLMFKILLGSWVALAVWSLFFLFFLGIELFIVVSKWKEKETDYDAVVSQQESIHRHRLALLANKAGTSSIATSRVEELHQ